MLISKLAGADQAHIDRRTGGAGQILTDQRTDCFKVVKPGLVVRIEVKLERLGLDQKR